MTNNFPAEEWRPVQGYEGRYEASSFGRVRAIFKWGETTPRILTPLVYTKGYFKYQLSLGKLERSTCVHRDWAHRIVYRAFYGEIPEGMTVNHIDGDKTNNSPSNLEAITNAENIAHARRNGLLRWRKNGKLVSAHLTADDVREIRRAYAAKEATQDALAKRFDTRQSNIRWILTRRTWKHVT